MAVIRRDHSTGRREASASRKLGGVFWWYQGRGIQVLPAGCCARYQHPAGVQPERQGGCAFGSLAFPGLRVLAAEVLFDVAEADLDGPATGVAGGGLGAGGGQVGGDEEVVGFGSAGVAHDGESNRLLR